MVGPSRIDMLHGPLLRPLFNFAIPVAMIGILQQLFNTTDIFILGRFVGTAALSAVSNDIPIVGILVTLFIGVSLGSNVVIARYMGGRKYRAASVAIHTTLVLAALMGIGFTVLGEMLVTPVIHYMDVPPEVIDDAELYLRVFLLGMPGMVMYDFVSAIYRSYGNVRTPLLALLLAGICNAVADIIVVSLGWGLLGVVGTTVAANYVGPILLLRLLRYGHGVLHIYPGAFHLNKADVKEILRIGIPAGLQGMVFNVANMIIQAAINNQGAEAMAASGVSLVMELNTYPFIIAFGQAITTFTGQNNGAGNEKRSHEVAYYGTLLSFGFTAVMTVVALLLARLFLQFFGLDEEAVELGVTRLYLIVGFYFLCTIYESLSASMRGFGHSLAPAIAMTIGICMTRVVWIYTICEVYPSLTMIMYCYPVSWLAADILIGAMYWRMRMQLKRRMAIA